jgi:uncharacterized damage-inducible protein DinB
MLSDSYDFVIVALQGLDPARLHQTYDMEGGKMEGFEVLLLATDHAAHHRGQCIVYLRAKGIKPVDYNF